MAGTKEELRKRELYYLKQINVAEGKKSKHFWERQLKNVKNKLYGRS